MDPERARELLATERDRVERALISAGELGGSDEASEVDHDPVDAEPELSDTELEAGMIERYKEELAAIERAEERLEQDAYGLSVDSGEPIPDGRLEAIPWAERTAEEQERWERGG
jgi:DnaK suppressor protein